MRNEPSPEELAAVERDQLARRIDAFKRRLRGRQRSGDVAGQSAEKYASTVLGKLVADLEQLSEEEFAALMLALNGGTNA